MYVHHCIFGQNIIVYGFNNIKVVLVFWSLVSKFFYEKRFYSFQLLGAISRTRIDGESIRKYNQVCTNLHFS